MAPIRPDRIATLYFFHPLRRLLRATSSGIPILMYHSISDRPEVRRNPYFHTCTAPKVFQEHMKMLANNGYKTIGLAEAVRRLEQDRPTTEQAIVLTFDDGFEDFYTEAFPILSTIGYTATVFLPTAFIGDSTRSFKGTPCLTWNQVRELKKAGIEFGSHTVTHPQLCTLPAADIDRELRSSKDEIEDHLAAPVSSFSYPYAFPEADLNFVGLLQAQLREAGYQVGVSTVIGHAGNSDSQFFMRRLPINSHDDPRLFGAKLGGAYNWLRSLQYAAKVKGTHRAVSGQ